MSLDLVSYGAGLTRMSLPNLAMVAGVPANRVSEVKSILDPTAEE